MSDKKFSLFQILALHNCCMVLTVMQRLVNDYAGAQNFFVNCQLYYPPPLSMGPKHKIFLSRVGALGSKVILGAALVRARDLWCSISETKI